MMHFSEKKWEDVHHVCKKIAKSAADGARKYHMSQFWHRKSLHIDLLYSREIVTTFLNTDLGLGLQNSYSEFRIHSSYMNYS